MPEHHPKLDAIRSSLRRAMPGVKSSHVAEAVARALGHRTNAALLASLRDGPEPDWVLDGPAFAESLGGLGTTGIDPFVIASAIGSASSWRRLDPAEALSPDSSSATFASYVLANQALMSTVVAQVFPHRFTPPRTGDMAWHHVGEVEAWTQVAHDGLMLGVGKGDLDAMRRRIVGWCVLATLVSDALGLAVRAEAESVPVRQVARGGWKAAFNERVALRARAWDDEADHARDLPSLRLPWPGRMGADMPWAPTFRIVRSAGCSDVRWFPDAPAGERIALSAFGHWIDLPDDPELETAIRPLLEGKRPNHACCIPGMAEEAGHLRVQVDEHAQGRRVTMRPTWRATS